MACFHHDGTPYARFVPDPRPKCASEHHNPAMLQSAGFDSRGWERFVCRRCLRVVGYRPPPTKHTKAQEATEEIA